VAKKIKQAKTVGKSTPGKTVKTVKAAAKQPVAPKPLRAHAIKATKHIKPHHGKHTDELSATQDLAPEPEVIIKTIKRSAAELKKFRERLQKLHDLAVDSIGFLAGGRSAKSGDSVVSKIGGDGRNTEEDGTENFAQELSLLQASNKQDMLNKIIEAFRRLDLRTYGVCEKCGELIAKARLEVQPFAPLCIKCQSAAEANRPRSQGFRSSRVQMVDSELNQQV